MPSRSSNLGTRSSWEAQSAQNLALSLWISLPTLSSTGIFRMILGRELATNLCILGVTVSPVRKVVDYSFKNLHVRGGVQETIPFFSESNKNQDFQAVAPSSHWISLSYLYPTTVVSFCTSQNPHRSLRKLFFRRGTWERCQKGGLGKQTLNHLAKKGLVVGTLVFHLVYSR